MPEDYVLNEHNKEEFPPAHTAGTLSSLASRISELIEDSRRKVVTTVNVAMVHTYYEIGRLIVEEEQGGKERAEYGTTMLRQLADRLKEKYGRGFSYTNLEQMRKFYKVYSKISQTLSEESWKQQTPNQTPQFTLSWSHYLKLMRIDNPDERRFYEIEATRNQWSLREMERQFDSSLYERLALSRAKDRVAELSQKGQIVEKPEDLIKDPYVLEFVGLPELPQYTEKELEQRLIDNLQTFLLELGKGFTFVGRQVRMTFDEEHYYIDLVFYNRLLRSFVLIDLKRGKLKHQDIGQMQMYVNYYDRTVRLEDENPTIGILLCHDKTDAMVEFSLPLDNNQVFASKYMTVLPSKEELRKLLLKE